MGDTSHGDIRKVWGLQTLDQQIGQYTFEISPDCFFQNNLLLVDQLYESAAKHVRGYTLDLFCGGGTIGIYAYDKANRIVGVDVSEANIELAHRNADRNGIRNIDFILDNANHYLAHYDGPVPDTVIIDPPRSFDRSPRHRGQKL